MENNPSAQESLAAVAGARSSVADRLITPWWYHPVLGVLVAVVALLVGGTFGPRGSTLTLLPIAAMLGLGLMYRRMTGVDLLGSATSPGPRANRVMLVLMAVIGGCLVGALVGGAFLEHAWAPVAFGGLAVVLVTIVGRADDRALRAHLRSETS